MLVSKPRVSNRAVALLLTVVMLNVFIMTGARASRAATSSGTVEATANKLFVGRLALPDGQSILVNGTDAMTGTTIFSGMRLQSPDGVNASVQLGTLGQLSFEPNTDLTLDFSGSGVEVRVAAGNATLTSNDGVNAVLTGADGQALRSEGKAATLSTKPRAVAKWDDWSNRKKAAAIIIPVAAAIVIIAIIVTRDDNNSPSNP
jgi:hypothetical protein